MTGGAALAAQNYADQAIGSGVGLEIWDRESLVQRIIGALDIGIADRTEGPLFALVGAIDDGSVTEIAIERFSRRWISLEADPSACILEAAIVAERLAQTDRLDQACYVALGIVRAAWIRHHGDMPPAAESNARSDLGRLLFRAYASEVWRRGQPSVPEPETLVRDHDEPSGYLTYPIRCMRYVEILSLLQTLPEVSGTEPLPEGAAMPRHIAEFIRRHPGCAHPVSDRWAVSIVAAAVVLVRSGESKLLSEYLLWITKWIADRYDKDHVGLASPIAAPLEEAEYLLARGFPVAQRRGRRSESYVSTIILDLAALSGIADVYQTARNEFLAVGALSCVLESRDDPSQYRADDPFLSFEPNVPYSDAVPEDILALAPHYRRQLPDRYLQLIGRSWDHLAVSSFLRDRHFLSAIRSIVGCQ